MKKCPECDSEKIINGAKLAESDGGEPIIAVDGNPSAMVFKKRTTSDITLSEFAAIADLSDFMRNIRAISGWLIKIGKSNTKLR